MRKILFRGKCTDNGKWEYGYLVNVERGTFIIDPLSYFEYGEFYDFCEVDKETVGQYTGLADRNGKKVFEGDIIKVFLMDFAEIGLIKFNDEMLRFMFCNKLGCYGFDNTTAFEVIGNIHDNPELLERSNENE